MKELLKSIVEPLLSKPEALSIAEEERDNSVLLTIHVAPEDMGSVIGKRGKRANAIRAIMHAKGAIDGVRVNVDIAE